MRLFVALDLDDRARDAIGALQARMRRSAGGRSPIRWVRAEHLHLTLVFLGEVRDESAPGIVSAIGAPVAQRPFDLQFQGCGVFPERGAPRALWVGAAAGADGLHALQRELAGRAVRAGVGPESRPFSPHLTLARWKGSRPSDRRILTSAPDDLIAQVRVDHATLYHSRLSSSGPTYTELARATLTTGSPA